LSYYNQINGIDTDQTPVKNALVTFQSYLTLYPGGEYTAEVTEKIRDSRDKQLQYEIYVGRFYQRTDKYTAAIGRFEEALKAFPEQPRRDEVLYYLGKAYLDVAQPADARKSFERLVKEFPSSQFAVLAARELPAIGK
jgi:outer membrane protein assembly factor BamD